MTVQVVWWALMPRKLRQAGEASGRELQTEKKFQAIPAERVRDFFSDMGRFCDGKGELLIYFPRCLALAAPVLLFRLKRTGFSGCTATVTDDGLLLRAIR